MPIQVSDRIETQSSTRASVVSAADTRVLEEAWAVEGHEVAFQDVFPFR